MKTEGPEYKRPRISTGQGDTKLSTLAKSHPFVQQERAIIDVILPTNPALESDLSSLKTRYAKGKASLAKLTQLAAAQPGGFVNSLGYSSDTTFLSIGPAWSEHFFTEEDVWCVDNRGVLSLSVSGDTYQTLGLVGKRIAFGKGKSKRGDGRHVISIPLQAHLESEKNRARRDTGLKTLEARRQRQQGLPGDSPTWQVLCSSSSEETLSAVVAQHLESTAVKEVSCHKSKRENMVIPVIQIPAQPSKRDAESVENEEDLRKGLFEWVGMAGLGSQRLLANDRVDPFVAVYDAPTPNVVGTVTHLRWSGFLPPSFVQAVIDCVTSVPNSKHFQSSSQPQFVSITAHSCTWSPVCYIPHSLSSTAEATPIRDPTRNSEDTWCLIITEKDVGSTSTVQGATRGCSWMLAESIGKHDARWG
ncbi:ribonuclease p protein subunit [Moniliophthora roreri MCA 2997]|uniref:Ribonuclease p protein subunit n=1 Tax=Moniliophthora roreri (strain MCA 2997) TaxID=1381753 RepID=V2XUD4_MONRO|nr:ribonuclease p protein subunit [Moniliophthora roreri MCA 2997]